MWLMEGDVEDDTGLIKWMMSHTMRGTKTKNEIRRGTKAKKKEKPEDKIFKF